MTEIPEEIRKMFPDKPIHKMDIVDGELHILASSEPLSNEPDFEHMPIEQVNQYLRDHGYDPEQVEIRGKILIDALIENIKLTADLSATLKRAEKAEADANRLQEALIKEKRLSDGFYLLMVDNHDLKIMADKIHLRVMGGAK